MINLTVDAALVSEETTNGHFARCLSITPEREQEIDSIMEECYDKQDTYPLALMETAKRLSNPNELAYAAFHLGAFAESRRAKYDLLNKLLGDG